MNQPKFQKGEWCYFEFELQQVVETEQNRITSLSDGLFTTSSFDLSHKCFPLTAQIKQISEWFMVRYKGLQKISYLNFPQIHTYFVAVWKEACRIKLMGGCTKKQADEIDCFCNEIVKATKEVLAMNYKGIKIFK